MRVRGFGAAAGLAALVVVLGSGGSARAQWGYPGGYGGFGWGGWGGGETVQGSFARGLGAFAQGAGYYNQSTAVANSINADTVMRWNQYWWESQVAANRAERERLARRQQNVIQTRDAIEKRLRENPEQGDIFRGDALNLAVEEINDPRASSSALSTANQTVPGKLIRTIPFQYAPGAVTISIHQLIQGGPPPALMRPEFEAERTRMKELGTEIRAQLDEGKEPDTALVNRGLAAIDALETKADQILKRGTRDRTDADRYLKALHGLVAMLKTPAVDTILAGVENRPDVSLGQLLNFMNVFNLRFGPANTAEQRVAYNTLWPKIDGLRDQVVTAIASAAPTKSTGTEAGEFFSGMSYEDLRKRAPAPRGDQATPPAPAPNQPPAPNTPAPGTTAPGTAK